MINIIMWIRDMGCYTTIGYGEMTEILISRIQEKLCLIISAEISQA
jgi:hypothetical protein